MSSTTLHHARKPYPCGMYPCADTIQPGALYVRYVAFPGEDGHEDGTGPRVIQVCAGCVDRNGGWIRDHYGVVNVHPRWRVEYDAAKAPAGAAA